MSVYEMSTMLQLYDVDIPPQSIRQPLFSLMSTLYGIEIVSAF